MKIVKFRIKGDLGHFKVPYSNSNPMTYSIIPKPAIIGMIGAVTGYSREIFKEYYPLLSENLKYSISLNGEFKKRSISVYLCNFNNYTSHPERPKKSPRRIEHILNLDCFVYILCESKDEKTNDIFENFIYNMENEIYLYEPKLGNNNCPCVISDFEVSTAIKKNGEFKTKTFVENIKEFPKNSMVYKENIPTHEDNNWYSDSKFNKNVFFTENGIEIESYGDYYTFNDENLFLI